MKTKYQSGFKEQALRKVFARASDRTVESIAIDLNMNIGTLRGWMKNASRDQKNPPPKPAHTSEWTAANRRASGVDTGWAQGLGPISGHRQGY